MVAAIHLVQNRFVWFREDRFREKKGHRAKKVEAKTGATEFSVIKYRTENCD